MWGSELAVSGISGFTPDAVAGSSADLSFVRGIEDDLNATLDRAATAAGDEFVNMAGASAARNSIGVVTSNVRGASGFSVRASESAGSVLPST